MPTPPCVKRGSGTGVGRWTAKGVVSASSLPESRAAGPWAFGDARAASRPRSGSSFLAALGTAVPRATGVRFQPRRPRPKEQRPVATLSGIRQCLIGQAVRACPDVVSGSGLGHAALDARPVAKEMCHAHARPRSEPAGGSHGLPQTHDSDAGDLAARALAGGRPAALDAGAVLHLQASAGNASVSRLIGDEDDGPSRRVKDVLSSRGGRPLDPGTSQLMTQRLGEDFSDVRVHTDSAASESARAVNAHAYTVGSDIVFQSDRYAPESDTGRRMLAHELTHVVQQRSGPVEGSPIGGGVRVSIRPTATSAPPSTRPTGSWLEVRRRHRHPHRPCPRSSAVRSMPHRLSQSCSARAPRRKRKGGAGVMAPDAGRRRKRSRVAQA